LITIQSVMFAVLGFLAASLLWLLAAPGFWARAVRLTSERLREAMPLTEAEIQADKDRMRAEYALKIHHQQTELNEVKLSAARQLIELNRRDARINGLETDVEALKATLEGAANARGVLEQTVADRLPRLEQRLGEAKQHLSGRDDEIAGLMRTAERQARALQEAGAINEQLKREVETLETALETAGAKAGTGAVDGNTDAVVAMRAELDTLRTRSREQSALIDRLQKAIAETADAAPRVASSSKPTPLRPDTSAGKAADESEKKLREARALAASQEQEIERLKAAVARQDKAGTASGGDSRIALKATLGALEEKAAAQDSTIKALRSEVAALQEQLTRQAADHVAAVGRLGGGTLPLSDTTSAASAPRERRAVPRLTLAERVAQSRRDAEDDETAAATSNERPEAQAAPETPAPTTTAKLENGGAATNGSADSDEASQDRRSPRIKSRLLDRISNLSKA
jgi:uncharacterized coiled-coil protein SlyX